MQPTHNLVTLPRREVGDRKGRGRRGYRPSVVEVPLADVIGSALAGASATGVFCLAKRLREGSDLSKFVQLGRVNVSVGAGVGGTVSSSHLRNVPLPPYPVLTCWLLS